MYIPEFVVGLVVGAISATALLVIAALFYDRHDKDDDSNK